jgi:hypothetical protein
LGNITIKNQCRYNLTVFCVVTPCSVTAKSFGGTYPFHLQGKTAIHARNQHKRLSLPPDSVGFLIGLLFDPEDGGNIFLRNVGLSPSYSVFKGYTLHGNRGENLKFNT